MNFIKRQFENWTLFLILGLLTLITGIVAAIVLMMGIFAVNGLYGIFIMIWMIPVLLVMISDRIFVCKFGNKAVNKIQFFILVFIVFLVILRIFANLLQGY
ncbi:hypothetical protein [Chryseobacterium sp.]|uniref:hypothetical protein n=1 Tax=Chryseobacterium sp. TaxID=1871047 RepID=UPI0023558B12|nr:hypothetical protein [Chryseobacterium sp.]